MQWWSDYLDSFSGENGKNQGVKTAEFKVNLPLNLCALFAG